MSKNPQHHLPEVPLLHTVPPLEQLGGSLFLAGLVLCPCLPSVSDSLVLLVLLLLVLLPLPIGLKAGENENGLDA